MFKRNSVGAGNSVKNLIYSMWNSYFLLKFCKILYIVYDIPNFVYFSYILKIFEYVSKYTIHDIRNSYIVYSTLIQMYKVHAMR